MNGTGIDSHAALHYEKYSSSGHMDNMVDTNVKDLYSLFAGSFQFFGLLQEFRYFAKGLTNRYVF